MVREGRGFRCSGDSRLRSAFVVLGFAAGHSSRGAVGEPLLLRPKREAIRSMVVERSGNGVFGSDRALKKAEKVPKVRVYG